MMQRIGKTLIVLLLLLPNLLMATSWETARWIGTTAEDQPLYSPYLAAFRLKCTIRLEGKATAASVIYGANDERLMSTDKNSRGLRSGRDSSMIRVEFALVADSACLRIWRVGYAATDRTDCPLATMGINRQIVNHRNAHDPHRLEIASCLGDSRFIVDDKDIGDLNLNPLGRGGDFQAFPVLAQVGVCVGKGQRASFADMAVFNYRSPQGKIADITLLEGVMESGMRIIDPSRNSMPLLRHSFSLCKKVKRAILKMTARGVYEAYVNGRRFSSGYLNPGITQYNKTHLFQTFDVTNFLQDGENVIEAQLAEGWWMGAATYEGRNWNYFGDRMSLLCLLDITYEDGTRQFVASEPKTWQYSTESPVIAGSLFQGEVYDARNESADRTCNRLRFDAGRWKPAVEIPLDGHVSHESWGNGPAPDDYSQWQLVEDEGNGIDSIMTLKAVGVEEPRPGVWVYDMGQNMVGVPRLVLRGLEAGTRVCLRYAEVKNPALPAYRGQEGMIMTENIRAAMAQDIYIAKGGEEIFTPRFTCHGYRFLEITGIDRPLPLESVQGVVLSSVDSIRAHYETSDAMVNRLWENIVWSTRGNLMSIPTDCPQRNERLGWAGDISVFSPTVTYLTHSHALLRRYLRSMRDVQHVNGRFPDVAPLGGGFGGLLWGSAGITVPWEMYAQWADTTVLQEHYPAMRKYIDYVFQNYIDKSSGIIVQERQWGDLGDWLSPVYGQDDKSLIWETFLIHDLDIMAETARVLGRLEEASRYSRLAEDRRSFFCRTYLRPGTGKTIASSFMGNRQGQLVDTQTSYVMPLAFEVVRGGLRDSLIVNLLTVMERENKMDDGKTAPPWSLLTGFIGTGWINRALSESGQSGAAYRLLLQRSYPSWLYPVTQGATTIWERLNSYTLEDGFGGNNRMNSFNHYSFGAVGYWMISHSLGIRRDERQPGFRHFFLAPEPDMSGSITYARGHYDSIFGRIESGWEKHPDKMVYRFSIPEGTSATLLLMGERPQELKAGHYEFVR